MGFRWNPKFWSAGLDRQISDTLRLRRWNTTDGRLRTLWQTFRTWSQRVTWLARCQDPRTAQRTGSTPCRCCLIWGWSCQARPILRNQHGTSTWGSCLFRRVLSSTRSPWLCIRPAAHIPRRLARAAPRSSNHNNPWTTWTCATCAGAESRPQNRCKWLRTCRWPWHGGPRRFRYFQNSVLCPGASNLRSSYPFRSRSEKLGSRGHSLGYPPVSQKKPTPSPRLTPTLWCYRWARQSRQ